MSKINKTNKTNKAIIVQLFTTFFKIGAFTFGGGYAMLPLIKREVIEEKKWLTEQEIFDLIAIAESTPGPLAINCATFVGSRLAGFWGAAAATLGVTLPSFVIILLISQVLMQIENFKLVKDAFQGIRAGVVVLIASALLSLLRQLKRQPFTITILAAAFLLSCIFEINTILVLILCALAGIAWSCYVAGRADK